MWAWAAACSPVAPRGARRAAGRAARRGRCGRSSRCLASQAPSRLGESQSARSWVAKRVRNARLIGGVDVGEQADGAGEDALRRCARSWLASRDPVADQVLAGAAGAAQRDGGRGVGDQWAQPGAVGAQGVGQHVGVEPVVLVAGRAVAAAQVLDLVGADHHHGQAARRAGRRRPARRGVRSRPRRRRARPAVLSSVAQTGGGVLDGGPVRSRGRGRRRSTPRGRRGPSRSRRSRRWAGSRRAG